MAPPRHRRSIRQLDCLTGSLATGPWGVSFYTSLEPMSVFRALGPDEVLVGQHVVRMCGDRAKEGWGVCVFGGGGKLITAQKKTTKKKRNEKEKR